VIDATDLMRLHVEALFTLGGAGRLLALNEPGGAGLVRLAYWIEKVRDIATWSIATSSTRSSAMCRRSWTST
jgi:hypothetical protein